MKNVHRANIVVLLALAGLFIAGCPDPDKETIRSLRTDNYQLKKDKTKLNKQIADAKTKETEWETFLYNKDGQIAAAQERIKELEAKLRAGGTIVVPTPPDGNGNGGDEETWTVGGDVLFASGRATLTTAGRLELNKVIQQLKSRHAGRRIQVSGHTDSDPIVRSKKLWRDNLHLSGARAAEVKKYMVSRGIPTDNIVTRAMGSSDPVATNRTRAGKQRNRRVEIAVIPTTRRRTRVIPE